MNAGTIIVLLLLLCVVGLVVRKMVRDKKAGNTCGSCGGNCSCCHYAGYIRYFSKVNGQVNAEVEDYVKQRLIDCQFKFRLDEPPDKS